MRTTLPARLHYVTDPNPKRVHEKWIVDGAFRVRRAGKNKSKLTDADGAIDVIAVRARLFGPLSVPSSEIGIVIEMLSGERPKAASASGRASEGGNRSQRTTFQRHLPLSEKGREIEGMTGTPVCVDTL